MGDTAQAVGLAGVEPKLGCDAVAAQADVHLPALGRRHAPVVGAAEDDSRRRSVADVVDRRLGAEELCALVRRSGMPDLADVVHVGLGVEAVPIAHAGAGAGGGEAVGVGDQPVG